MKETFFHAQRLKKMSKKIICVSGGFDPVHIGHLRMIQEASKYGHVVAIVNSDDWLMRKKGYIFMPFDERCEILEGFTGTGETTNVDDTDGTVCEALRRIKPDYFANGGDRKNNNTPEMDVCEELGVKLLWGIGGDYKADASSTLVERFRKSAQKEEDLAPERTKKAHSDR